MIPDADPLHKVTIIPRGMALGVTMQLADRRQALLQQGLSRSAARDPDGRPHRRRDLLHHITTGAGNDIERATDMARKMVCEWGMSELGPLSFGKKEEQIFLGREIAQHRDYSEATAIRIDEQVRKLVEQGYQTGAQDHRRAVRARWSASRWRCSSAKCWTARSEDADRRRRLCPHPHARTTMPPSDGEKQQVITRRAASRVPGLLGGERPQPA